MPAEIGTTLENLQNQIETNWGDLRIISGEWYEPGANCPSLYISVAWSGWGKVSAARAATRIIGTLFKEKSIDIILFTGVAGAANSKLNQWDIVIPTELVQHDMDARPFYQRYVIPALKQARISAKNKWVEWASSAIKDSISKKECKHFGKVKTGLIATGDRFLAETSLVKNLSRELPGLYAVEMEGAAVAQVAYQERVPWLIVRVISDGADNSAAQTFNDFLKDYEKCSWYLIETLLKKYTTAPWKKKIAR